MPFVSWYHHFPHHTAKPYLIVCCQASLHLLAPWIIQFSPPVCKLHMHITVTNTSNHTGILQPWVSDSSESQQQPAACLSEWHLDTCSSRPWASQGAHLSCHGEGENRRELYRSQSRATDYRNSFQDITRDVRMPKLSFSKMRFYEIKDFMPNMKRPRR